MRTGVLNTVVQRVAVQSGPSGVANADCFTRSSMHDEYLASYKSQ
jgi:hypothetical protein